MSVKLKGFAGVHAVMIKGAYCQADKLSNKMEL